MRAKHGPYLRSGFLQYGNGRISVAQRSFNTCREIIKERQYFLKCCPTLLVSNERGS